MHLDPVAHAVGDEPNGIAGWDSDCATGPVDGVTAARADCKARRAAHFLDDGLDALAVERGASP